MIWSSVANREAGGSCELMSGQLLTLAPRTSFDPARAKALLAVDGDDSPFAWAALSGHPRSPKGRA